MVNTGVSPTHRGQPVTAGHLLVHIARRADPVGRLLHHLSASAAELLSCWGVQRRFWKSFGVAFGDGSFKKAFLKDILHRGLVPFWIGWSGTRYSKQLKMAVKSFVYGAPWYSGVLIYVSVLWMLCQSGVDLQKTKLRGSNMGSFHKGCRTRLYLKDDI